MKIIWKQEFFATRNGRSEKTAVTKISVKISKIFVLKIFDVKVVTRTQYNHYTMYNKSCMRFLPEIILMIIIWAADSQLLTPPSLQKCVRTGKDDRRRTQDYNAVALETFIPPAPVVQTTLMGAANMDRGSSDVMDEVSPAL